MKLPRLRTFLFLGLAGLLFGALPVWWASLSGHPTPQATNLSHEATAAAPAPTFPVRPVGEAEQNDQANRRALFRAARQQARLMRNTSNPAALLAVADHPEQALAIVDAMSPAECRRVFGELLLQPVSKERSRALESVLLSLALRDVDEAIELRKSVPDPALRNELTDYMLSRCPDATKNPEKIARWLSDEGQRFYQADDLATEMAPVVAYWGSTDPKAAAEFLLSLSPNFDQMSAQQSEKIFDLYGEMVPPLTRTMREICEEWSRVYPQDAMAWAAALPETDGRRATALSGALKGLTNEFPDQAKAFAEGQVGISKDAPELARAVAAALTVQDRQTTMQWAATLSDPATRDAALAGIADAWIKPVGFEGELQYEEVQQVLAWANTLPADAARGTAWASVAAKLAINYPEATREWLQSLPTGKSRDDAMTAYDKGFAGWAKAFFDIAPASAMEMLQTGILDPEFSSAQIKKALATWTVKDNAAATQWATEHGVAIPAGTGTAGKP